MGLFSGYDNKAAKTANKMGERNADVQERLYHLISEGLINEGGPDYGGQVDYFTDMPIYDPLTQAAQSFGAASTFTDKSQALRDAYQSQFMGGGLGGLLGALGINTDADSFGGLPGFFSGGGLLGSLGLGGGGGGAPRDVLSGVPRGTTTGTPPTMSQNMAQTGAQMDSAAASGNMMGNPMIKRAIEAQGGTGEEDIFKDPYYQGTLAMQSLRQAQQDQANSVGNELLQLAGLGQQPGIGFGQMLPAVRSTLQEYDPNLFNKGREELMGAKPLDIRQAEAAVQQYAPVMGMPMSQAAPGGQGAGQGRQQVKDILGLLMGGYGIANQMGFLDNLGGASGGGGIGGLATGSSPFISQPAAPAAPSGGGIGSLGGIIGGVGGILSGLGGLF